MATYSEFAKKLNCFLEKEERGAPWLSSKLAVSQSTVLRWCNGETRPNNYEKIIEIARILGITSTDCEELIKSANYKLDDRTRESIKKNLVNDSIATEIRTRIAAPLGIPPRQSLQEELNHFLARYVPKYESEMYRMLGKQPPPNQPYKFLYAYDRQDSDIFFGRDAAVQALHQIVLKDRMTILHAKSGAGKTSLLNAGLSPNLMKELQLPIYARAYPNLISAIKQAIVPASLGWPQLLPSLSLHEFLGYVCTHKSKHIQEIIIILDQFEEFFIFYQERSLRNAFVDDLANVYNDKMLPVRFVIAIRKDYYSDLAEFHSRIPSIFDNTYWLDAMTLKEARQAITAPIAKLMQPMYYEHSLIDMLINDIDQNGVELPYLQIICTQLYDDAFLSGKTYIETTQYEQLGRVLGILGAYLKKKIESLPGRQEMIAKAILVELVSSQTTKRVVAYSTLSSRINAQQDEFNTVLSELVRNRLLRRDELNGVVVYEMAHEYLIEQIKQWLSQEDLLAKKLQELLDREMINWRLHGSLIPRDRLEVISAKRVQIGKFSDEILEFILRSSVQANFAVGEWAEFFGKENEQLLLDLLMVASQDNARRALLRRLGVLWEVSDILDLGDENLQTRQSAVSALEKLHDTRFVEPLIAALRDEDAKVRCLAATALGVLKDKRAMKSLITALQDRNIGVEILASEALRKLVDTCGVEPLIVALQDEDVEVRRNTVKALEKLGDTRVVESLIAALQDEDAEVRRNTVKALEKLGDTHVVEPLIIALQDEDVEVRRNTVKALEKLGDTRVVEPLIAVLQDEDVEVRRNAVIVFGKLGAEWKIELIFALRDEDTELRRSALNMLAKMCDAQMVESLIVTVHDEDKEVREDALWMLEQLGRVWLIEPLIAALQDEDVEVRRNAVKMLEKLGDVQAVEPLIAALRDEDAEVRRKAVNALEKLGDARVVEPLIAALRDEDVQVRRNAIGALGEMGDRRAVEPLIADLRDEDADIRSNVAYTLGVLGDERAVKPLIALLNNEYGSVLNSVVRALRKFDTIEVRNALRGRLV